MTTVEEEVQEEHYCFHCGAFTEEPQSGDWLCSTCERYQDSAICPTCHSVTSLSALPEDQRPEAHAPESVQEEEVKD